MALEDIEGAGRYLGSLNPANPVSGDDKREGDNHIRGIKNTLRNTFPNVNGATSATAQDLDNAKGGPFLPLAGGALTGDLTLSSVSPEYKWDDQGNGNTERIWIAYTIGNTWRLALRDFPEAGDTAVALRFERAGALLAKATLGAPLLVPGLTVGVDGPTYGLANVLHSGANPTVVVIGDPLVDTNLTGIYMLATVEASLATAGGKFGLRLQGPTGPNVVEWSSQGAQTQLGPHGWNGKTGEAIRAAPPAATDLATVITLANDMRSRLIALGVYS